MKLDYFNIYEQPVASMLERVRTTRMCPVKRRRRYSADSETCLGDRSVYT